MTDSFSHLLALTVVALVVYVVADLVKTLPIYEALLENLIEGEKEQRVVAVKLGSSFLDLIQQHSKYNILNIKKYYKYLKYKLTKK